MNAKVAQPLFPANSFLARQMRSERSRLAFTVFVVLTLHILFLCGLLIAGCSRGSDMPELKKTEDFSKLHLINPVESRTRT